MKYHLITYGCQMNVADSEMIAGILESLGMEQTMLLDQADLVVFNTCMVREKPELRLFNKLSQFGAMKRANKELIVIVAGCVSQRLQEEIFDSAPAVDIVLGPRALPELPELIAEVRRGGKRVTGSFDESGDQLKELPVKRFTPHAAYATIIIGCNNFCSYCVVPYTRGREKCFSLEVIEAEIRRLLESGAKEITLLGQNVNSWQDGDLTFPDLLKHLDKLPGEFLIRFMTSHPKDMSEELIACFGTLTHLEAHVHLPVQSGSNRVLDVMNRRYTVEHYLSLVDKLRKVKPDIAITTDFIAGFPGETLEEHQETLALLHKVRFDTAFTFYYSERPGTKACDIAGGLSLEERKRRLDEIIETQVEITAEKNQEFIGKRRVILIDGPSKRDPKQWQGRTSDFRMVNFTGVEGIAIGQFVEVEIIDATKFALKGKLL